MNYFKIFFSNGLSTEAEMDNDNNFSHGGTENTEDFAYFKCTG
ncbi:hypothetical protein [Pedobacter roseus]|jgi:hypothetical protein|nr:hypothetical protein [Pedobacter roseus]